MAFKKAALGISALLATIFTTQVFANPNDYVLPPGGWPEEGDSALPAPAPTQPNFSTQPSSASVQSSSALFSDVLSPLYFQFGGGLTRQHTKNWKSVFHFPVTSTVTNRSVAPDDTSEHGYIASLGVGYALPQIPLRLDLTYIYLGRLTYNWMDSLETDNDTQPAYAKMDSHVAMFNASWDFINRSAWIPFVTGGVGVARIANQFTWSDPNAFNYGQNHVVSDWHTKYNLAWQVGAGVYYQLNAHWWVGALANYMNLGATKIYFRNENTDALSFDAVKLSNVSLLASLVWRPMANPGPKRYTPIAPLHNVSTSLFNRFYVGIGGGPAWQHASDWKSINGMPSIQAPKDSTLANIQAVAKAGYAMAQWPIRWEMSYGRLTQVDYDWPYLYQDPQATTGFTANQRFGHAKVDSHVGLVNVAYDLVNSTHWVPFVSLGAGVAHIASQFSWINSNAALTESDPNFLWNHGGWHSQNNFAWQAALGTHYLMSTHWMVGVEANYINLGKTTFYRLNPETNQDEKHHTAHLSNMGAMVDFAYRF